ncbi:MAG: YfiH family protein [Flammeovirgaceae bacterium]|jgi:YfiH family protein
MKLQASNKLPLYQFENFSQFNEIRHYVSTRAGGVSEGNGLDTLNVSFMADNKREAVIENRKRITKAISISPSKLIFPSQTHEDNIVLVDSTFSANSYQKMTCTDALITNQKGFCVSIVTADCVPVLLFDSKKKVVSAVHAGWRGTVKMIAQKAVLKMQADFDSKPKDIWVGIGPSISPEVYEVGNEVIAEFIKAFGTKQGLVSNEMTDGKGFVNLWEANKRQLTEIGIPESQIEIAGICTYSNPETFFSARRNTGKGGRFASGIYLV